MIVINALLMSFYCESTGSSLLFLATSSVNSFDIGSRPHFSQISNALSASERFRCRDKHLLKKNFYDLDVTSHVRANSVLLFLATMTLTHHSGFRKSCAIEIL